MYELVAGIRLEPMKTFPTLPHPSSSCNCHGPPYLRLKSIDRRHLGFNQYQIGLSVCLEARGRHRKHPIITLIGSTMLNDLLAKLVTALGEDSGTCKSPEPPS